jgi:hypothetical protein
VGCEEWLASGMLGDGMWRKGKWEKARLGERRHLTLRDLGFGWVHRKRRQRLLQIRNISSRVGAFPSELYRCDMRAASSWGVRAQKFKNESRKEV